MTLKNLDRALRKHFDAGSFAILLAQDDEAAAKQFITCMEHEGYDVHWAASGLSALEMTDGFIPDIALIRLDLPELNGFEVAQAMHQNPDMQHTIYAALTRNYSEEEKRLALAEGFHYYFRDPINPRLLERLMRHALPAKLHDPASFIPSLSFHAEN